MSRFLVAQDCPFCDIIHGRGPATVVRRWDDAIAIVPLRPVTYGHLLVIPTMHVPDALADPTVTAATMRRAAEVARERRLAALNIITSVGAAATQTVPHLHAHIVPRVEGDGLALPWPHPVSRSR
ncbi:HIT family protein [Marinactinospora thermotolerans]|uniref:HIT family protein n=1 Tax=Marinactinospora thermotolerans TaxID=531310 RepID=UPI003D8BE469